MNKENTKLGRGLSSLLSPSNNMKDDLGEKISHEFPKDEDYDTLGGLVLSLFGKFPSRGESIDYNGFTIIVKEVQKRRILKLDLIKKEQPILEKEIKE